SLIVDKRVDVHGAGRVFVEVWPENHAWTHADEIQTLAVCVLPGCLLALELRSAVGIVRITPVILRQRLLPGSPEAHGRDATREYDTLHTMRFGKSENRLTAFSVVRDYLLAKTLLIVVIQRGHLKDTADACHCLAHSLLISDVGLANLEVIALEYSEGLHL